MLISKFLAAVFVLFLIHGVSSKPIEDKEKQGQGILSTVWGWITYPFTWWSSGTVEESPSTENFVPSSSPIITENFEIGKRNVTVWCNDQTCITMKCDIDGCVNITCNIYDTDLKGECREYNISTKSIDYESKESTSTLKSITEAITRNSTNKAAATLEDDFTKKNQTEMEHPLELEVVMSSTILQEGDKNQKDKNWKNKTISSPQNKIK